MDTSNNFSCFIIGEGTLPIQCAVILLDRAHTLYGILSSDAVVHAWAGERAIPHIDTTHQDILTFLRQHPFDYLFSIVNPHILSQQVLALPRRSAINFHDAPLPRYAGLYVTSWAIMQGERIHGVTWHAMTELVDDGDILKQHLFAIDDRETAFTLNAKCYAAAISSFTELIDDITWNRLSARKQHLNQRTFFPFDKRPPSACILSWNQPARAIDAFFRALDFGSYPNPIGLPKIALGMDALIVSEIEVFNSTSAVPPGTVTHIDPRYVRVATIDGEIALRKLLNIDGQPLPISDFVAKFGLYEGYQFQELDPEVATRISAYHTSICQQEAFWTKRLEKLENITLPYAHRKTPHIQPTGRLCVPMPVPREILTPLENRYGTWSVADVLLTAFAAYLARIGEVWSFDLGYSDIELKSNLADLEGIFAANVPLHVGMEHRQSFEEVFRALQKQVQLVKQRKTYARDLIARHPVLRSKANLQGYLPSIFVERVETLHGYKAPPSSELTLLIREDKVECLWAYNAEVFDEESIVEMQYGFTTFLHGIVSEPQQRISDLPLLTKAEKYRLLVEWNATETSYPKDKCIHQLFEAQVERTPSAIAVAFEDERLTYQELNSKANHLAHYLQRVGVGPEILVGICMERSLEMAVGLLGILKSGGAYVPLDPVYPKDRLTYMLEDALVPVLLTQQHLLENLPELQGMQVIPLDTEWEAIAGQGEENPASGVSAGNLAYVIYTSGSTGKPMGVQIEHKGVVNHSCAIVSHFGFRGEDRVLQFASISFDTAVEELFPAWSSGATVVLRSQQMLASPDHFLHVLEKERLSILDLPTAFWHEWVSWLADKEVILPATLRLVFIGGEAVLLERLETWRRHVGDSVIWSNGYGPTEATVNATIYEQADSEETTYTASAPIGRPIANVQFYVLDQRLQLVPVGVPGELYIGGDGLARGYLNRPELTAERFIAHPFSLHPGARLYKTGDLVRYLPDGNLEFLGRIDHQVKIRGFRIELGEIEIALAEHPAVREAVVLAREDVRGEKRLVAYVTAQAKQPVAVGDLRRYLKERLPDYMIPASFVLLETLPLTPNGKVDRRALPVPDYTHPELEERFVAPRNALEEVLSASWSQVLGIKEVGIHDDFFALVGQLAIE